jgi:hypothetical protein
MTKGATWSRKEEWVVVGWVSSFEVLVFGFGTLTEQA